MELRVLRWFAFIPVIITFTVFTFLFFYYSLFYLYPCIKGDYYATWKIPYMWSNQQELDSSQYYAKIYLVIFLFCATNLFVSIVLTIQTSPGHIPEAKEWNMPSNDTTSENIEQQRQSQQINSTQQRLNSDR